MFLWLLDIEVVKQDATLKPRKYNELSLFAKNKKKIVKIKLYLLQTVATTTKMAASPVTDYYKNKNVFITGGTGFLGIALIDKILRSCSDVCIS